MKVFYDPSFLEKLKKVDVRIKKSVKERLLLFSEDSSNLQLNNHPLRGEYAGYSSINITTDHRALYKKVQVGNEVIAYFVLLGTHKELYG